MDVIPDVTQIEARFCVFISILMGAFASILNNVEIIIRCGAALAACVSAGMAARYYYYAATEKRELAKKMKQENKL